MDSLNTIYSDGAFNKDTKPSAWASIVDAEGNDLVPLYLEKWSQYCRNNEQKEQKNDTFTFEEKLLNRHKLLKPKSEDEKGSTEKKENQLKNVDKRSIAVVYFPGVLQQNNCAELIALVLALRLASIESRIKIIYTDSQLLEKYWSKNHVNENTKKTMDANKLAYILECATLRKQFEERGGTIQYISGDLNLSDLGYHVQKAK